MRTVLKSVPPQPRPAEEPVILNVEKLGKSFVSAAAERITVLRDVAFSARRGELLCVLGRSGCGKSTLLKLLAGFLLPDSGAIMLNGRPVTRPGPERCVVFQEDALFPWLTVRENIAVGLKRRGATRQAREKAIDRFLELVGLKDFGSYLPREISGGMKQRVALARVLILEPEVLLMDEPFAALDAQTREEMQNLLLSLQQQVSHTILFVTHDVNEAVLLADRILLMGKDPGRILEDIRVDLLRPRQSHTEAFITLHKKVHEIVRSANPG